MPMTSKRAEMKATNEKTGEMGALEALVVDNPDIERLEVLLGQFNIFEALRAVRQEARHSAFLAYLLDPAQNHSLGDDFARRLLQKALASANAQPSPLSPIDLDVWSLTELVVLSEWHSIDLLLLDAPHRLAVLIENKIDSSEHSDQLRRYFEEVQRHYPQWNILGLYLSPEGDKPSHEAYVPIDYLTVCKVVERLVESRSSTIGADVRTLMVHYTQMLRRHIVAESEIAELCRRIYHKHRRALDMIYEYRPDQQAWIRETLEELIQKSGSLALDHCSKSAIRFVPTEWDGSRKLISGGGWTPSGRILLYQFTNISDKLQLRLYIGPGPDPTRQGLFAIAKAHPSLFRLPYKTLYPKWNSIYDKTFLTSRDFEDATDEQLGEEIAKHWKRFAENDLPAISAVLRKEDWLWQHAEDSGV
jgi:hypothetical protein